MKNAEKIKENGDLILSYYYSAYAYVRNSFPTLPFNISDDIRCSTISGFCDECCAMKATLFRMVARPLKQPYSVGYFEHLKLVDNYILNEGNKCPGQRLPWNEYSRTRAAKHQGYVKPVDLDIALCEILVVCLFTELFCQGQREISLNHFSTLATIFQNIATPHIGEKEATVLSYLKGKSSVDQNSAIYLQMLQQARIILENYFNYDITKMVQIWPDEMCGRIDTFDEEVISPLKV